MAKSVLIALSVLALSRTTGQDKPAEAWWLNATFPVTGVSYDSVPINYISPMWIGMSVLTYSKLPPEAEADVRWMRRNGYVFEVDNQFRRKGATDREICGVFEDREGRKGRFLLVLERAREGPWNVAYLHQEAGEAGFSVLVRRQSGLYWGTCMQCGEFSRLRLNRGGFVLDQAP